MTVAGQFYDADKYPLQKLIESFCSQSKKIIPESSGVRSIIAPHAGYLYSGKTACEAYFQAKNNSYDKIVLISPSHYVGFSGISLPDYSLAETPFGNIEIDLESAGKLDSEFFIKNSRPHVREHSLEVHLPLIKFFFPQVKLLPLVCGQIDGSMTESIASSLLKLWDDKTLWIISSDFTHYGKSFGYLPFASDIKNNLAKLDRGAIERILAFDEKGFSSYIEKSGATICGSCPIRIILSVLTNRKKVGDEIKSKLISYTTSGELTGDFSHCVSYASIVFYS
ncbi:MAG: AmmeMemoRadiSam system protein B [Lentisphaerae bacterium GWF2_38_69]|nr:MAG: AmmeMemoRadiSam system protein B [Lentisphaerae bacterium GWF2_38_69]